MCAINGVIYFDSSRHVDPDTVDRMTDCMAHRGPDARGTFIDRNVALGHRRLAIIDLSDGNQPIFNEDGSVVAVFNGEIYNYVELTSALVARGHHFKTKSDTETIVHAYEEYGDDCPAHFRGMFAIALWDRTKRRLILTRDRLGIKPLYFYQGPGFLAFASEIKALFEVPGVPRQIDMDSLANYVSLRYVPGPATMFKGISKLQPGHMLVCDGTGVRINKYWDIQFHEVARSYEQQLDELKQLLEESVRLRLISEVPLGVFLSGGLDSSSILATMTDLRRARGIDTFSVGYRGDAGQEVDSNEFEFAQLAANTFKSTHHECRIGPGEVRDILPKLVWHLDEPLADPTCVPLYYLSQTARERITVTLSGEGADEIMGGYSIYGRMLGFEAQHRRFGAIASALSPALRPLMPGEKGKTALDWITMPLTSRYRGVSRAFLPDLKAQLLPWDNDGRSRERLSALFGASFRAAGPASALDQMLYVDTRIWLPDDLLLKADKMTMAHGVELRVPFLDHKLVEFAATLPADSKLRGNTGKALLRDAMQGSVPDAILHRKKKGFPVPTSHWLRTELHDMVHDALLSPRSAVNSYMDTNVIERTVRQHESSQMNREHEIWTLLIFEFWHRAFIDQSPVHRSEAPEPVSLEAV